MEQAGFDASLIMSNVAPSQLQWLHENGVDRLASEDWHREVVRLQIEKLAPDVLYLVDPITFDAKFLSTLSTRPSLIVGWRAANIPEGTDWTGYDVILSSLQGVRDIAPRLGARHAENFWPGFPSWLSEETKDIQPTADVVFCGLWSQDQHKGRGEYLCAIAEASINSNPPFSFQLYLSGDTSAAPRIIQTLNRGPRYGLDMHKALRAGRIAFDSRGTQHYGNKLDLGRTNTANMRLIEATGSGVFLLSQWHDNLGELFEIGKELETYRSKEEMLEKIRYYTAHPEKREEIAERGRRRCIKDHSLEQRAAWLRSIIDQYLPRGISERTSPIRVSETKASTVNNNREIAQVNILIDDALSQLKTGAHGSALALLEQAFSHGVSVQDLHHVKAIALLQAGRAADGLQELELEIMLFPGNRAAQELLASLRTEA